MVHIPKAKQNGKLNQQSAKCIFVGYPNNSKGHKFYNPIEKKIIRSNDVVFFENGKYVDVNATLSVFPDIYVPKALKQILLLMKILKHFPKKIFLKKKPKHKIYTKLMTHLNVYVDLRSDIIRMSEIGVSS